MDDFLNDIINNTVKYYTGREVVIWGYNETSLKIKDLLADRGIHTAFMVDRNYMLVDGDMIRDIHCLEENSDKFFVVIPIGRYRDIIDMLRLAGYEKNADYYYFSDCVLTEEDNYYEDAHGNKVYGNRRNIQFVFSGFHSVVKIGRGLKIHGHLKINIESNCDLHICDNVHLGGLVYLANNSEIEIGHECSINSSKGIMVVNHSRLLVKAGCKLRELRQFALFKDAEAIIEEDCVMESDSFITIGDSAKLYIGKNSTFNYGLRIEAVPFSIINIGTDCMFSWNINLLSGDGHSIFDVISSQNVNYIPGDADERKIDIKNHVWAGSNCIIMYRTKIGEGSVIGAGSIVKGVIPANCIAAGQTARCIRKHVAWSRNDCSDNINDCGEYIHLTRNE